jgi:hypothetical protein
MEELVSDGRYGFVVQKRNVKAAAARIDDVFSGRVDAAAIVRAASEHIVRAFDVTVSMASYQRHWRNALRRRAGLEPEAPPTENVLTEPASACHRPSH